MTGHQEITAPLLNEEDGGLPTALMEEPTSTRYKATIRQRFALGGIVIISVAIIFTFVAAYTNVKISTSQSIYTANDGISYTSSGFAYTGDVVTVKVNSRSWNSFICQYSWSYDGKNSEGEQYKHTITLSDTTSAVSVHCNNWFGQKVSGTVSSMWYTVIESNQSVYVNAASVISCNETYDKLQVPLFPVSMINTLKVGDVLYTSACSGYLGSIESILPPAANDETLSITYTDATFESVYVQYAQPDVPYAFAAIYDNTSAVSQKFVTATNYDDTLGSSASHSRVDDSQYTVTWTGGIVSLYEEDGASLVVNFKSFGWTVGGSTPTLVYSGGKLQQMSIVFSAQISFSSDFVWEVTDSMSSDKVLKVWRTLGTFIATPPTVWNAELTLGVRTSATAMVQSTWTAEIQLSYSWQVTWSQSNGWSSSLLSQSVDHVSFAPTAFVYSSDAEVEVYLSLGVDIDQVFTFGDEQVLTFAVDFDSPMVKQQSLAFDCDKESSAYWQWSNSIIVDFHLFKWDIEKFQKKIFEGEKHYITLPKLNLVGAGDDQPTCLHFREYLCPCNDINNRCNNGYGEVILASDGIVYSGDNACTFGSNNELMHWQWESGTISLSYAHCYDYPMCPANQDICATTAQEPFAYNVIGYEIWSNYYEEDLYYWFVDVTGGDKNMGVLRNYCEDVDQLFYVIPLSAPLCPMPSDLYGTKTSKAAGENK